MTYRELFEAVSDHMDKEVILADGGNDRFRLAELRYTNEYSKESAGLMDRMNIDFDYPYLSID